MGLLPVCVVALAEWHDGGLTFGHDATLASLTRSADFDVLGACQELTLGRIGNERQPLWTVLHGSFSLGVLHKARDRCRYLLDLADVDRILEPIDAEHARWVRTRHGEDLLFVLVGIDPYWAARLSAP